VLNLIDYLPKLPVAPTINLDHLYDNRKYNCIQISSMKGSDNASIKS
jgi:hypothetical protein